MKGDQLGEVRPVGGPLHKVATDEVGSRAVGRLGVGGLQLGEVVADPVQLVVKFVYGALLNGRPAGAGRP